MIMNVPKTHAFPSLLLLTPSSSKRYLPTHLFIHPPTLPSHHPTNQPSTHPTHPHTHPLTFYISLRYSTIYTLFASCSHSLPRFISAPTAHPHISSPPPLSLSHLFPHRYHNLTHSPLILTLQAASSMLSWLPAQSLTNAGTALHQ